MNSDAQTDLDILLRLRKSTGLFILAPSREYNKVWVRDNVYTAMSLEAAGDSTFLLTYHTLFDSFKKQKSTFVRFNPDTYENEEPWNAFPSIPLYRSDKQYDALGLFLFKVGELQARGIGVIRDNKDLEIVKNIVKYLETEKYYSSPDNGMWEDPLNIHASSIGACVAGLENISASVEVSPKLIDLGKESLSKLLPKESPSKDVDMSLLSLIWPFNVAGEHSDSIVNNVEKELLRSHGVIRYHGDRYWNAQGRGEAEWPLGLSWLAIVHKILGNIDKYQKYLSMVNSIRLPDGSLPESFHRDSEGIQPNPHTPLGWAHALYIIALSLGSLQKKRV